MKRNKRMRQFEEQFPEALDFLARSMRAGHAFSVSLEMMADESPDPLGFEFRRTSNEQNLGAPLEVALRGLANRVPLLDVRFFVAAVLLQRQTGGNLAEVLTKLAYIIRERFRLKSHIRTASTHGRLTAAVLTILPIFTVLGLMLINPGYVEGMAADVDGRRLLVAAMAGQITGYLVIRKMVNIEV
jgi:tight adherence protein B